MNKMIKAGLGLAAGAAVVFAAGCGAHAPAYQCGKIDYKSMASCKGMATTSVSKTTTVKVRHHHTAKKAAK